eukprot:1825712-Amphidinium_carterae.1
MLLLCAHRGGILEDSLHRVIIDVAATNDIDVFAMDCRGMPHMQTANTLAATDSRAPWIDGRSANQAC